MYVVLYSNRCWPPDEGEYEVLGTAPTEQEARDICMSRYSYVRRGFWGIRTPEGAYELLTDEELEQAEADLMHHLRTRVAW